MLFSIDWNIRLLNMEIRRLSAQGPESISQYYSRLASDKSQSRNATSMLKLIDSLSNQVLEQLVWAKVSPTELMFLLSDDPRGRAFANVRAEGPWYFIECAMSPVNAPWPDAWVKGHTSDLHRACSMIITAWDWSQDVHA